MGQSLFAPPNVKGWTGGKTWLNSATVLARQNFAQHMLGGPQAPQPPGQPPEPTDEVKPDVAVAVVAAPDVAQPQAPSAPPDSGVVALLRRENAESPSAAVDLLTDLLLQGDIDAETRKKLTGFFAEGAPKDAVWEQRVRETAHALMTLPEYTLA
jgi:hypothetical protein